MAVDVGDIIRVAAKQKVETVNDIVNVFHFQMIQPPAPPSDVNVLADLAELVSTAYANIASKINNSVLPDTITAYSVTEDRPIGVQSWPGPYAGGTSAGEGMPTDDALLVVLPTLIKRTQGRIYLGPFTEANQANSRWISALIASVGAFVTDLRTTAAMTEGGEYQYVVYSRGSGLAHVPTSARIQPLVAQQERRKLGRGS